MIGFSFNHRRWTRDIKTVEETTGIRSYTFNIPNRTPIVVTCCDFGWIERNYSFNSTRHVYISTATVFSLSVTGPPSVYIFSEKQKGDSWPRSSTTSNTFTSFHAMFPFLRLVTSGVTYRHGWVTVFTKVFCSSRFPPTVSSSLIRLTTVSSRPSYSCDIRGDSIPLVVGSYSDD